MKVSAFGMTDVGRKRSKNEDCFLCNDELLLYVVADGMGGHSGGEFASNLAVTTIEEVVRGISDDPEATVIEGVNTDDASIGDRLKYAIQMASSKIFDRALYDNSLKGMGTTAVACLLKDGIAHVAHVGDSRAYLIHANKIRQLTKDHSLVAEQVAAGVLSKQDAKGHKLKNVITRSVGYQEDVESDLNSVELHMGDKLLLCSDGLSNMLEDEALEQIISSMPVKEACKKLVEKANEKGGDDNISAVLIEVTDLK